MCPHSIAQASDLSMDDKVTYICDRMGDAAADTLYLAPFNYKY
jgi:hypothetical protein